MRKEGLLHTAYSKECYMVRKAGRVILRKWEGNGDGLLNRTKISKK